MKRSILCKNFLKVNEVNCCSIKAENENNEAYFSWNGCDCCQTGLGTSVYDCNGYNPKTKQVIELGAVCHDCICYFYNGDDSEIESVG